jgi:hypothetical protein
MENKNWEKANVSYFGEESTECFIDDIEKWVEKGGKVILQVFDNIAEVRFVDKIEKDWQIIFINEKTYYGEETKGVYWNKGKRIVSGKLFYKWDISAVGDILIWWDHDLGDVVIDRTENVDEETHCGGEKICKGVYFYWIT